MSSEPTSTTALPSSTSTPVFPGFKLISAAEIEAEANAPAPAHGDRFGSWTFDDERLTLDNGYLEVDLERMTTPRSIAHEIVRLASKNPRYVTNADIGDLLRALLKIAPHYAGNSLTYIDSSGTRLKWKTKPSDSRAPRRSKRR